MSNHIIILGAGISGLATAWYLKKNLGSQAKITVLDQANRVGGWIQTSHIDGFLFEQGPRSCRSQSNGHATLTLVEELELQNQVIVPHSQAHHRYLYDGKGLRRMPDKMWKIPFNSLTKGWLKAFWSDWHNPKGSQEDESIHDYFSRRIGPSWTENLIDPFVTGIYAGNCATLSMRACFPRFFQWERSQGSLMRGAWYERSQSPSQSSFIKDMSRHPMFSFIQGMETLPMALEKQLKGDLLLGKTATGIRSDSQSIEVQLHDGMTIKGDYVISTLPIFTLGTLIQNNSGLSKEFHRLPYSSVYVLNFGYRHGQIPLGGFGYLVPSRYGSKILGCVWDSSIFPQQNREKDQQRLAVMMGGSHHPEIDHLSDQELIECSIKHLHTYLGVKEEPQIVQIKKAIKAIPQYPVGYHHWKKEVAEQCCLHYPRLILSGSGWNGVSINDCIAQAKILSKTMTNTL